MKADDAAYVDDAFVQQWQSRPLAAIVKDSTAITDADGVYRCTANVGTLLPLCGREQECMDVLVPAANGAARPWPPTRFSRKSRPGKCRCR